MTEAPTESSRLPAAPRDRVWGWIAGIATLGAAAALLYDFWTPFVFLAGYDTYTHDYLMWQCGWEALLRDRSVPLWDPYLFGGWPFVASFAFCPFYPPAWVSVPFAASLAITLQYALHLAIGGAGFYAFARTIRLRPPLALTVALLYETSSHVATLAYPGHLAKVQAIAWIGWAMAGAVMLARDGRARWGLVVGAAWAMQLLASHTQIFYATFWMTVFYVGAAWAGGRRDETGRPASVRRLVGGLCVAGLIGVSLSAVQLLPSVEMSRISNRAGGVPIHDAVFGGLPPGELAEIVLPCFRGDSTGGLRLLGQPLPYVGTWHAEGERQAAERLVSDYVGVWPALLALAGVVFSRQRKRWFFLATATAALGVSLGDYTHLCRWAYYGFPGFSRFRSPATFMVAFNFSAFALAGLGLEAAVEYLARIDRAERRRLALVCVAAGFALGATATVAHLGISVRARTGVLRNEDLRGFLEGVLLLRAVRHSALFLALGSLVLAPMIWAGASSRFGRGFALVFVGIAILDTSSHVRHFFPRQATAGLERYLKSHWIEDAVLADAGDAFLPSCIEAAHVLNNRSALRGVRSTHGYHPVIYGEYERLLSATGGLESPVLQRHFAQNYQVLDGGASAPLGWHLLREVEGRRLFARDHPIPFARIPRRVAPLGGEGVWEALDSGAWADRIGGADFDPADTAIAEGYAWDGAASSAPLSVSCRMETPDEYAFALALPPDAEEDDAARRLRLAARLTTDLDGFIPCLVPIPAGPGWRVGIRSGESRAMDESSPNPRIEWLDPLEWPRRANGFFLLIPLSPHSNAETVLAYRPASFGLGIVVTCAALIALFGLWGGAALRTKSRRLGKRGD
ncbi:hypothetical protein JW916_08910 [Candidatus Sumerlaeota bacterium]|nr:hypothetical protein [Candidatus Sumerlaeota bacterium]